jgi:hypothetical protein
MEITISNSVPPKFQSQKGTTYETKYLYTGFGKFNTAKSRMEAIEAKDGRYIFTGRPHNPSVFSRVYHTELATVTEYEGAWSETVGDTTFFFQAIVH